MTDTPTFFDTDIIVKRFADGVGLHATRPCELREVKQVRGPLLPWSTTSLPVMGEWFGVFLLQREIERGGVFNAVGPFKSTKDAEKWLIWRMQRSGEN